MAIYEKGLCSVCCLGYKHADFLEKTIRSIWEGEYKRVEIIAVDDGSNDGSAELLRALAADSPCPMTVVVQENTGRVSKNLNIALKKARGEYVSFIALDDYLYPEALSKKIAMMSDDERIAFVGNASITGVLADGVLVEENFSSMMTTTPSIEYLIELEYENLHSIFLQGFVVRKEIVDNIGGFDEDLTGDDIVLRTKLYRYIEKHPEYNFVIFNEPACYYRLHGGNVHKNPLRQMRIASEYLARYWPEREPPEVYVKWFQHAITVTSFEEYVKELAFNSVSSRLLLEPRIQQAIKKSLNPVPPKRKRWFKWPEWIFHKKRDGSKRTVKLFSIVKWTYNK